MLGGAAAASSTGYTYLTWKVKLFVPSVITVGYTASNLKSAGSSGFNASIVSPVKLREPLIEGSSPIYSMSNCGRKFLSSASDV